jgi:phosphoadenosine phosphosulfate reductase
VISDLVTAEIDGEFSVDEDPHIVVADENFDTIKVSPVFYWSDADMESYLKQHNLPNEWDYFDPAKADEKRECGLHADWGADAAVSAGAGI